MSLKVTGNKLQLTTYQEYEPGASVCACLHCTQFTELVQCDVGPDGLQDWAYDTVKCCIGFCTSQYKCSKPDVNQCPVIGGKRGEISWTTNNDAYNFQPEGRQISCTYNVDDFKTADDLETWLNNFGYDPIFINNIMPVYCPQQAEPGTCPTFPPTSGTAGTPCAGGLTGCSRMSSTDKNGAYCSQWASNYVTLGQEAGSTFCGKNICASDCKCYNRSVVDPLYKDITSSPGAPPPTTDACWYKPCQDSPPFLIPSNQVINQASCPKLYCEQVVNIIGNQGSNINVDIAKANIDCNITNGGSGGSGGTGDNPSIITTIWDKYYLWIIIGGSILLVIVIILIIYAVARSRSNNNPP